MSHTFYLEILSPGRKFYEGNVESLVVPGVTGYEGILAGHMPVVISLKEGEIQIKENGKWRTAVTSGGFIEVEQEKAILLSDAVEWPEEIDINRAKAAKERAEERLRQKLSQIEYLRSKAALARALARLKAAEKMK